MNPIAIVLVPSRALLLCLGLLTGYGVLALGALDDFGASAGGDDVSCVELLP